MCWLDFKKRFKVEYKGTDVTYIKAKELTTLL